MQRNGIQTVRKKIQESYEQIFLYDNVNDRSPNSPLTLSENKSNFFYP